MPKNSPKTPQQFETPSRTRQKSKRGKKRMVHHEVPEYTQRQQALLDGFINKVIEIRKIQSMRHMYEQMPQILQYIVDSYEFGELGQLSRRPSQHYLQLKIERRLS